MVTHTGTSWGYGALLTLIPSMKLGIYTGVTGPDRDYVARRMIHLYTADLLLGETPWINMSTACTFPEPWSAPTPHRSYNTYDTGTAVLPLKKYAGTYGNFGYGNLTVYVNQTTGNLQIRYGPMGLWDLFPGKKEHFFFGQGLDLVWAYNMEAQFIYNCQKDIVESVTMPAFERKQVPMFKRGLQMTDAPPPPKLVDSEDIYPPIPIHNDVRQLSASLLLLVVTCIGAWLSIVP